MYALDLGAQQLVPRCGGGGQIQLQHLVPTDANELREVFGNMPRSRSAQKPWRWGKIHSSLRTSSNVDLAAPLMIA